MVILKAFIDHSYEAWTHYPPRFNYRIEVFGDGCSFLELNLSEAIWLYNSLRLKMLLNSSIHRRLLKDVVDEVRVKLFEVEFDGVKTHVNLGDHIFKRSQTLVGDVLAGHDVKVVQICVFL